MCCGMVTYPPGPLSWEERGRKAEEVKRQVDVRCPPRKKAEKEGRMTTALKQISNLKGLLKKGYSST